VYVVAAAARSDADELQRSSPDLWREVRRFNRPVQLAVAACNEVACFARDPKASALVALAPCQGGSPQLFRSAESFARREPDDVTPFRLNPIYTLHAVDNLALSAMAIALGHHGYGVGFGGAAGQAWEALDLARERLERGAEREVLLFAGDQQDSFRDGDALGVALLLAVEPRRFAKTAHSVAVERLEWTPCDSTPVAPHAARGLLEWVRALQSAPSGRFRHVVDAVDGDGSSRVTLHGEVSCVTS